MGKDTWKILNDLTDKLVGQYPGITISVEEQKNGPPVGKPINLEIHGQDFNHPCIFNGYHPLSN